MKVVRYSRLSLGKALSRNIPGHAPVAPATLPGLVAQHHGAEHRRLLLRQTVANLACFRQLQQGRRRHCLRRSLRIGKPYGALSKTKRKINSSDADHIFKRTEEDKPTRSTSWAKSTPRATRNRSRLTAVLMPLRSTTDCVCRFETTSTPISLRRDRFVSTYTCYPLLKGRKHNEDH